MVELEKQLMSMEEETSLKKLLRSQTKTETVGTITGGALGGWSVLTVSMENIR